MEKQGNRETWIRVGSELGVSKIYDNKIKINNRIIYLFINFPRSKLKPPRFPFSLFLRFSLFRKSPEPTSQAMKRNILRQET